MEDARTCREHTLERAAQAVALEHGGVEGLGVIDRCHPSPCALMLCPGR
jgi:hypothetical protein